MYNIPSNHIADEREFALPDFDELKRLADERPAELEQLRQDLCARVIEKAPEAMQARLKGLQFRIDAERRLSSSPMGACIRISRMMNESLADLSLALNDPETYLTQYRQRSAKVVSLFSQASG